MNKAKLHYYWTKLRAVNSGYFLVVCVVFGAVGILAYRQNNVVALQLRDQVLQTDKENGNVEKALRQLRAFTYAHMNANLANGAGLQQPIQLKYRYERLVQAEKARVAAANSSVYTAAQGHCEQLYPHSLSGGPRVPCIQQYVTDHGAKEQPIPDALYKFDFVSPRWSFDLAGWSLLIATVAGLLFVLRALAGLLIRRILDD